MQFIINFCLMKLYYINLDYNLNYKLIKGFCMQGLIINELLHHNLQCPKTVYIELFSFI